VFTLHQSVGRCHAPEERIEAGALIVPQVRQTCTAIGVQTRGQWGYHHGVNAQGVAAGCTRLHSRQVGESPRLRGPELVRLALERARTARQAIDLITDLLGRYGQGTGADEERGDSALLIADAGEAFVLETAGRHWAYQEVREVRAVSDVRTVRQDWDGIAPGFASHAIDSGWWPADGSKVDFAGVVAPSLASRDDPMRRWGRATLLLEEQNGHIDVAFVRRLLSDHYEGCSDEVDPLRPEARPSPLCPHSDSSEAPTTGASLVAPLAGPNGTRMAWCCPGPPCVGIYLPVLLAGDVAEAYGTAAEGIYDRLGGLLQHSGGNRGRWDLMRDTFGRLQARLDVEVEEYAAESAGAPSEAGRRATLFMRHALERFEETVEGLVRPRPRRVTPSETPAMIYP
jgi:secernin